MNCKEYVYVWSRICLNVLNQFDFLLIFFLCLFCHVIGERTEVTPMISIDPHSVYHFGYLLFLSLSDLTTKVNSFDDLNKNGHFFY